MNKNKAKSGGKPGYRAVEAMPTIGSLAAKPTSHIKAVVKAEPEDEQQGRAVEREPMDNRRVLPGRPFARITKAVGKLK
jgi:hypothetical protein